MTADADADATRAAAAATAAERQRLARRLHDGVVQQVTALSLAVDSALLRRDGGGADVDDALRAVRALADRAVRDCRALMDDLNRPADP